MKEIELCCASCGGWVVELRHFGASRFLCRHCAERVGAPWEDGQLLVRPKPKMPARCPWKIQLYWSRDIVTMVPQVTNCGLTLGHAGPHKLFEAPPND